MRPLTRERREGLLRWLLRLFGAAALLAVLAVPLPFAWMDAIHRWLGMGPLPEAPIVGYLARALSLFYALFGALLLVVAHRVERDPPLVRFVGWASVVAGASLTWIDLHEGLPAWWSWHEGPAAAVFGVLVLWLARDR